MKLRELVPVRGVIEKLASKEYELETSLVFAKFTRQILEKLQTFDILRSNMINKYGTKDSEGGVQIKPEFQETFKSEMEKILDQEVQIEPLDVSKVNMKVAPADLINILNLFK